MFNFFLEKWQEEERKFEARMREREKNEQQFRDNWVLEELRLNNLLKEKEQQVIFSFISNYVI
jgi:hypothetical protein